MTMTGTVNVCYIKSAVGADLRDRGYARDAINVEYFMNRLFLYFLPFCAQIVHQPVIYIYVKQHVSQVQIVNDRFLLVRFT